MKTLKNVVLAQSAARRKVIWKAWNRANLVCYPTSS